jgi:hypothetical protein
MAPTSDTIKEKLDQLDYMKIHEMFIRQNKSISIKRQLTNWEINLQNISQTEVQIS